MPEVADRYIPLIQSFIDGAIAAPNFQDAFLRLWREDRDGKRTTGDIIDNLMTGVDCYDENPDLVGRIDADQLRAEAAQALVHLTRR